ncbi:MAG: zinc-ribbon domain-containing protein [Desulfobacteraceae bacterium]|nr:zinc-ribbon domain-containing protein [Desulfobacteraceae bacterium]
MRVTCGYCGKKYRFDERKMTSDTARLRCKSCSHVITVNKSSETPSEPSGAAPKPAPAASPSAHRPAAAASAQPEMQPKPTPVVASQAASEIDHGRFGLFPKLILLTLLVGLVPFFLFWYLNFSDARARMRSDTERLMSWIARGQMARLDEWLDENQRILQAAARMPDILSMNRLRQEPVLQAIQRTYPWMLRVCTVDHRGRNKARSDGKPLQDVSGMRYYQDIVDGKSVAWQTLMEKQSRSPSLALAVPIHSGDALVGSMTAVMNVDDIGEAMADLEKGGNGHVFLVDDRGIVLYHSVQAFIEARKNLNTHPLVAAYRRQRQPLAMEFTGSEEVPSLGYVLGNPHGWVLAVVQQEEALYGELGKIRILAFLLMGGTVAWAVLMAWLAARKLSGSINP